MEPLVTPILQKASLQRMKAVPESICSSSSPQILFDSTLSTSRSNEMLSANPTHTNLTRTEVISNVSNLSNVGIFIHTSARKQFNAIMMKNELHQQCIE